MGTFDPVKKDLIRVGAAYLTAAPTINMLRMTDLYVPPSDALVRGIPALVPVARTGVPLGYTQGIKQSFNSAYEERVRQGSTSFTSVFVKKEEFNVSGSLVFNNDILTLQYLLPQGIVSSISVTGGGKTSIRRVPLLVILTNRLNESPIVPVFLYYNGYFETITIESGRDFHAIDFIYRSGVGLDKDGCLFRAGERNYIIWWYNVYTGEMVMPADPDVPFDLYWPMTDIPPMMM